MATNESTHVVPCVVKIYQKWYIDDPCGNSLSGPETGVDVYCREFNCESNGIRGLSWILGARGQTIEKRGKYTKSGTLTTHVETACRGQRPEWTCIVENSIANLMVYVV